METKTKKILIASSIIGALLIVGSAILLRSRRKKLEDKIKQGSDDVLVPAQETVSQVIFPIKRGYGATIAEKNVVKVVQRYINAKSSAGVIHIVSLVEDGLFGPLTESALYKLFSVKEVSYSLYKEMYNYLYQVPTYLSKETGGYSGSYITGTTGKYTGDKTDPSVVKNDLLANLGL
jgi:hypothetical protein